MKLSKENKEIEFWDAIVTDMMSRLMASRISPDLYEAAEAIKNSIENSTKLADILVLERRKRFAEE